MKIIKKIISVASACIFAWIVPCGALYASDMPSKKDESYIYRNNFTYYAGNEYENSSGSFCVNVVARKNGHVTIDVQGFDGQDFYAREFCNVTFDDSVIAEIGSVGYSGMSTYTQKFIGVSNIKRYQDNTVTYALFYNDYASNMIGENVATFDLYVNQEYMDNEIDIVIGGKTVSLPYGECYQLDFNPTISRLRNELIYAREENAVLQEQLDLYEFHYGDINYDGKVDAVDSQIILKYYVDKLAGKTTTLSDYARGVR